jgi:hypothetical protein
MTNRFDSVLIDSFISGFASDLRTQAYFATTPTTFSASTLTYAAPTLTVTGLPGAIVDGTLLVVGQRILIKDAATAAAGAAASSGYNGIWVVDTVSAGTNTATFEYAPDWQVGSSTDGKYAYICQGTTNGQTEWRVNSGTTVADDGSHPTLFVQTENLNATQLSALTTNGGLEYHGVGGVTKSYINGAGSSVLTSTSLGVPQWVSTLTVPNGGTGVSTTPTNGQLLIGNGTNYTVASLLTGTGISTTAGAGSLQINNTGVTSLTTNTGLSSNVSATGAVTVTNTGVLTFSGGTTGLTPSSATAGAVTLGGVLAVANGGTGATSLTAHGVLVGEGTSAVAQVTAGSTYSVLTANSGTSSDPVFGQVHLDQSAAVVNQLGPANGGTGASATPTNGQLLIGNGTNFTVATLASGTGISTTTGSGTLQINNTGVTSNVAGTGISVSGATGAVTISNTGVLSFTSGTGLSVNTAATGAVSVTNTGVTAISAGTTGLSYSAATGSVTLSGTLVVGNGGTGATSLTSNGLVYGNGSSAVGVTAAGTTGQVLIGTTGSAPSWTALSGVAVTSFSAGTTGLTPSSATQGAVTLGGTLGTTNGGTGLSSYAKGDILYASAANTLVQLNSPSVQSVLQLTPISLGGTGVPVWLDQSIIDVGLNPKAAAHIGTLRDMSNTTPVAGYTVAAQAATYATSPNNGQFTTVDFTATANFDLDSAAFNGTITGGTTLTVNSISLGSMMVGQNIFGVGVTNSPMITAFVSGVNGGAGVYTIAPASANVGPEAMTAVHVILVGDRILVKNQTDPKQNGIYTVSVNGSSGTMARSIDMDGVPSAEVQSGDYVFVEEGYVLANSGWVLQSVGHNPLVLNTDPLNWSQFNGSGGITAGTGISITGNTISNTGVLSFQTSLSGLTPSSATTGTVTLAGTLGPASGGTGATATPTNGQLLIGNGTNFTVATLASGTGISTTTGAGTLQVNNTGVTAFTSGTGLSVNTAATGSVSVTNTGVLSFTSGTGLSVNTAATGAVSVTNTGVTAISAGTTGLSYSASTGSVTLSGTLVVSNGGTGATSLTSSGILYGNGTSAVGVTAAGASNTVLHGNGAGAPTFSAVDLTADVTNTLPVSHGGTGATTITGILLGNGTSAVTAVTNAANYSTFVSTSGGVPSWSNTAIYATSINDSANHSTQMLELAGGNASANVVKVANTASGGSGLTYAPVISTVAGNGSSDTNIDLKLQPLGTGAVDILNTGTNPATLNMYNGSSNYIGLTVPTLSATVTYTLPVSPVAGYVLQTNGSGVLTWVNPTSLMAPSVVSVFSGEATATSTTLPATALGYYTFPTGAPVPSNWYLNCTTTVSSATRGITIQVVDANNTATVYATYTNSTIGTFVQYRSSAWGSAPTAPRTLAVYATRAAGAGQNPVVYGIQIELNA